MSDPKKAIHVMMVDDERDFLQPVSFWLKSRGYMVTTTSDPAQAVDFVKHNPPDILFLDLHMPGMDGVEVLRQIRSFNHELPIIIVTAAYHDQTKFSPKFLQTTQLGIAGFFPKQENLEKLGQLLEVTIRTHGRLRTSPEGESAGAGPPT